MSQPQDFINAFDARIRSLLKREADHVGDEGASVTDAAAANSLVIEGKFTGFTVGGLGGCIGKFTLEINIYRLSDHVLAKMLTTTALFSNCPFHAAGKAQVSENAGMLTGSSAADPIKKALKEINLSSIPAGPRVPWPPAPSIATAQMAGAAQPAAPAFAAVQLSSTPAGAEITIDGAYAGNTPSLIKLRPGTHSIRIAKDGYTPWERSIDTGAGEARNLAANLEKTGP